MSSVAVLQSRVLYGLKTDVDGNINYLSDAEILYPVGNALAFHNFSQHRQRLLRLAVDNKHQINIIAVTPSKKYVAICEMGEKPMINIYDANSLRRKKSLGIPYDAPGVTKFSCVSFSNDSRCLAAVTGEPDETMLFYAWEKGKVESSIKVGNNHQNMECLVKCIACNPGDCGVIALGGLNTFKFLTVSETVWRPYGYSKSENLLVSSMSWLNTERLLVGTLDGRILYLESGELKNIYNMSESSWMNLKIREEYVGGGVPAVPGSNSQTNMMENNDKRMSSGLAAGMNNNNWPNEIRGLIGFQRGFAYGHGPGKVVVWEREGQHKCIKRHTYLLPVKHQDNDNKQVDGGDEKDEQEEKKKDYDDDDIGMRTMNKLLLNRINSMSVNPSNDTLVVTTGWSQLFCAKLWGPEIHVVESSIMRVMGEELHQGAITGLSMCAWKSTVMSCGGKQDRSVRLWDYERETLLMVKQYEEEVNCLDLHPSGLFCLIGFTDKLRFMSILLEDLVTIQEIAVRNCKTVSFCQGGQLFAAVYGNIIQIYTTIEFTKRYFLKGHTGIIKRLLWSQNDMRLLSIGTEGALYQWDITNGRRTCEIILKGVALKDVVATADGTIIYCISTSDDKIREIRDNTVTREFTIGLDAPAATRTNINGVGFLFLRMLGGISREPDIGMLVGATGGLIAFVKYPLQDPLEIMEFHVHSEDITSMCLSFDEKVFVSGAQDGTLCFWRVAKKQQLGMSSEAILPEAAPIAVRNVPGITGPPPATGPLLTRTNEILVEKGDLEEKVRKIEELSVRMRELETEHAYKMRQSQVQQNDKVREIHRGYCEAIEELRAQIERIQEDRGNELNSVNREIGRMMREHEEEIRKIEMSSEAKLINEYDKYRELEEGNNAMRIKYEADVEVGEKQRLDELAGMRARYEAELHSKGLELAESHDEMAHQVILNEESKRQIEEDADREIVELRSEYEAKLAEESRTILKLKGEAGLLRNKYHATRKETEELKRQIDAFYNQQSQTRKTTHDLEKDLLDLKKEITERDVTIQDKEIRIYELKRDNQELDKFKFVLNYKIRELKSQIEPRDREIKQLHDKITDMETELINIHKTNVSLELQLQELRDKLHGSKRANQIEIINGRRLKQLLRKIRFELAGALESIQDPHALKNAVIQLHHRYSADDELSRNRHDELRAECEFSKQRDHLERTVRSLRKQPAAAAAASHQTSQHYSTKERDKLLNENIELLLELNAMRKELSTCRKHILDVERLLGLTETQFTPQEARNKLFEACHGHQIFKLQYRQQIHECQQIIIALRDDIKRLLAEETTSLKDK